jgi:hypothetical protein
MTVREMTPMEMAIANVTTEALRIKAERDELLAALKRIITALDDDDSGFGAAIDEAKAVIAKVEGRS